jgi:hypothetical protein
MVPGLTRTNLCGKASTFGQGVALVSCAQLTAVAQEPATPQAAGVTSNADDTTMIRPGGDFRGGFGLCDTAQSSPLSHNSLNSTAFRKSHSIARSSTKLEAWQCGNWVE